MDNLFIPRNVEAKTPEIDFNVNGNLRIDGRSVSENPVQFFEPIMQWINELKLAPPPQINLIFKLEYFNTSTSKIILQFFRVFENMMKNGTEIKTIWFYDPVDDDMLQAGKDYQSILRIPFEFEEM